MTDEQLLFIERFCDTVSENLDFRRITNEKLADIAILCTLVLFSPNRSARQ